MQYLRLKVNFMAFFSFVEFCSRQAQLPSIWPKYGVRYKWHIMRIRCATISLHYKFRHSRTLSPLNYTGKCCLLLYILLSASFAVTKSYFYAQQKRLQPQQDWPRSHCLPKRYRRTRPDHSQPIAIKSPWRTTQFSTCSILKQPKKTGKGSCL